MLLYTKPQYGMAADNTLYQIIPNDSPNDQLEMERLQNKK